MSSFQYFKDTWDVAKNFLDQGSSNLGPFTWNLTEGNLGINPQIGGSDADQMGIIMNGKDDILLRSDAANIDVPLASLMIDGSSINGLATTAVATSVTPFKTLIPSVNKYMLISIYVVEILRCLTEDDKEFKYNKKVKYEHEIFDYDYYDPVEGTYNPPELGE